MARHDEGFFTAKDNVRLFWESHLPEEPRAHVALIHGYGDHCGRYRELVDHLVAQGLGVHGFDFRGHGQADGRRGYVHRFEEYVDDLDIFWRRVQAGTHGKPTFLFGHSTGALIALHWLHREPQAVAGLVMSAPYLKLALRPPTVKLLAARVLNKVVPWIALPSELTSLHLSRDESWRRKTDADPLYNRIVTPRFFIESLKAQAQALAFAPKVTLPILVACGEQDGVASTATTRAFFAALGSSDKQFKEYPGMLHEIVAEVGKEEVWRDISGWISRHV